MVNTSLFDSVLGKTNFLSKEISVKEFWYNVEPSASLMVTKNFEASALAYFILKSRDCYSMPRYLTVTSFSTGSTRKDVPAMAGIVIAAIATAITDLRAAERKLRDSIYICFSLLFIEAIRELCLM